MAKTSPDTSPGSKNAGDGDWLGYRSGQSPVLWSEYVGFRVVLSLAD